MMLKNNKSLAIAAALTGMMGMAMHASALPDVNFKKSNAQLKSTASGCKEAQSAIDLNINNVSARIMTGGDMWYDRGTGSAAYEIPKGSNKNSLFAGSSWIGGYDAQGQLKVAAQTYRQNGNDYWPGPLDPANSNTIDAASCSEWDRFWKVDKSTVNEFKELFRQGAEPGDPKFDVIKEWPAKGNIYAKGNNGNALHVLTTASTYEYAPYVDFNGDGHYNYQDGDYPDITGDQYIWWVFNDKGNIKGETKTDAIGLEVQTSAFAYSTKDALNDASFFIYRIINRGPLTMDSTYMATWTDADLGYAYDDYIGCDTVRGLGIEYNGNSIDGSGGPGTYGNHVPMVGVDFFRGPHKYIHMPDGKIKDSLLSMQAFTYFNNDGSSYGNPTNGIEIYNYMTGSDRRGEIFNNDFQGAGIPSTATHSGPKTRFVFFGDPENQAGWSECNCSNPVGDRRFIHSAGAFQLIPGAVNDLIIGSCWVADVGGCPNTSFKKIRAADDVIQSLFDAGFRTTEGPEAPKVVVREMDRKLIFYMYNEPSSNNYKEQYGYVDSAKYRVPSTKAKNYVHAADSLYKFEGYRVFQLKTTEVGPGQIYNSDGSINTDVAAEVFQCDLKNGVTRIINYNKVPEISDSTWVPVVKVEGKDSGIVHSFELTTDVFAAGSDKRLVNYKNYHYVVIAYAYNNFAPFNPRPLKSDSTQDLAYLESLHGANGSTLEVLHPMPNPANGAMGTTLNSDYGSGVVIHKLEGLGNGGNIIDIDDATEQGAIDNVIVPSKEIVYRPGAGPIAVKVADPQKVKPVHWELSLTGNVNPANNKMIADANSGWTLVNTDLHETIYSEQSLEKVNEQLISDYGLSISIAQAKAPYEDEPGGNGYLTSLVFYDDNTKPWLAGVSSISETNSFLSVENWIRTGNVPSASITNPYRKCNFGSFGFDTVGAYAHMFSNTTLTKSTWAPYSLASIQTKDSCQFGVAYPGSVTTSLFFDNNIHSVDLVFTADKSKWSKCAVIEEQAAPDLSEGGVKQFNLRAHQSWTGEVDASGQPIYSTVAGDKSMSYFPGYAIDQETGQRLNIVFGEDSYLKTENGGDMIWNPTYAILNDFSGDPIFGGKHYIYIASTAYDGDANFVNTLRTKPAPVINDMYKTMMWVGLPTINPTQKLLPLKDNLIPTTTRLKFRVSRPYAKTPDSLNNTQVNGGKPHYMFSTTDLAPSVLGDNKDDKSAVLKRINVTPNPYYGYTGYETSRLDTRVRIVNLPHKATIDIYSLDGTLIRRLTKDDANTSYIDWDVRNAKGLPIASGMYLMHVNAEGVGEVVLRWFGAMRPLDITSY